MFSFFKKKTTPKQSPAPLRAGEADSQNSTQQHTNIQRELVRVVLKDTLRLHGVPASWLACEVLVLPRRVSDEDLIVQMIILKWSEMLLRFAPVLQRELLQGLDRFDPAVDHSRYIVSWRFAPDCGCPFTEMPEPRSWTEPASTAAPATPAETVSILDRRHNVRPPPGPKFDLPPSERDHMTVDFAATVPSELR